MMALTGLFIYGFIILMIYLPFDLENILGLGIGSFASIILLCCIFYGFRYMLDYDEYD